ncbi:chromosomal replication initiator protein DnaA [Telmatocola sphagniphila]|uniref:Chromosomal replication initiator protein DnaA n=1 Tax=Telmatocola sphagniphila TaxID=1123043 RepID=A0A8E6B4F3_9BACT|nr:chromosomal replication initiator protein DnaA [Telmatocola sphagniphila]QVL31119.1 chromosomal replication initiator protein DnaA [Telmatocola sphagniphila]
MLAPVPASPVSETLSAALIRRIGEDRYNFWFTGHTRIEREAGVLKIACRNPHSQEWLRSQFSEAIQEAAQDAFGEPLILQFSSDEKTFPPGKSESRSRTAAPGAEQKANPASETGKATPQTLFDEVEQSALEVPNYVELPRRPANEEPARSLASPQRKWRSLNDFIVGSCNRVAHATAISIIESPGQEANPLVLYGPCGTGKTHLLESIYVGLRKRRPMARLTYITAEEFLNRFVQMLKTNKQANFRRTFRECDALFLDDLSFLAGKRGSQEEFLHTFDVLQSEGRQVVVTLDTHPRLCDDLIEELVDRLLGGAIASLMPPDTETRFQILRAKTHLTNPPIPDSVLQFLAGKLRGNVRELEGAIHSIRHFSKVTAQPVTLELAQEALGDLIRHAMRVVNIGDVEGAVCEALRLPSGILRSKQRTWMVSHPRMIAIYLSRKHTTATYGEISAYFGNKTHSTAVAAEKKVKSWLAQNEPMKLGERDWMVKDLIDRIERTLQR